MKKYWSSIEEFKGSIPVDEGKAEEEHKNQVLELIENDFLKKSSSRRDFLKVFGYSVSSAVVLASCRRPVHNAIPYVNQPPEITPGKALYYASSFFDGHEYAAILVKTRDGRPIKVEGNNLSEFNKEGTTARVQASVLSLYDDARLKRPASEGSAVTWDEIDPKITADLAKAATGTGTVVLLTSTIISPATRRLIGEFGSRFRNFRWIQYDAISYSAILEANLRSFGKAVIPDLNFQNADMILSVNADFLGTWVAPVHFIPGYASRRKPGNKKDGMLKHVHFESGMSLTGSNADQRFRIRPSEEKILLADLYNRIAEKTGGKVFQAPKFRMDLADLAGSLVACKGRSIIVSGTNDPDIQFIVTGINQLLSNYDSCIDLKNHINVAAGLDSEMEELVDEMNNGSVNSLLMYNVNPLYDYHDSARFLSGLKKTDLTVSMVSSVNETTGAAKYDCPVNHYLESWDDAEPVPGLLSLCQPGINYLFETRSFQDSLLKWSENPLSWHDFLRNDWEREYFKGSGKMRFTDFWDECLCNGVYTYKTAADSLSKYDPQGLVQAMSEFNEEPEGGFEVIITESVPLGTGMHSNNPWLMELPDPVSKHCWDNVASLSPSDAEALGISTGDLINLGNGLILPAFIQPGQAEGTISAAIGYGHTNSGPVANRVGVNLYPFVTLHNGSRRYGFRTERIENTKEQVRLSLTQVYSSMEGRPIVRETVLSRYRENNASGNETHAEFEEHHKTLYPDVSFDGFHWGMAIDLNACVGCNACVIACQAENNIPVVGREEVRMRRIMHWIKIDRYYSDSPDDPKVYFQPITCQHCDNAPCENVCPVAATNHSNEGLNQMTYNRCIGTKYCINNCPYKARRFNWYRYTNNKAFDFNTASDLGRLVLNPDVTVRERGVVEKCSFCVQRIQEKKLQAKLENRILKDEEIKPACMQACPAGAIIFGNLNDRNSRVSAMFEDQRRYHLLEELHTLPSVGFLTKVWNDEEIKS
jgi:MoCo/4Fe-4S cofactor protein with predicted Tat translocation signal